MASKEEWDVRIVPGTNHAKAKGCRCPRIRCRGLARYMTGNWRFDESCPVHGEFATELKQVEQEHGNEGE